MLWIKAFHIISVITWFAALFYLPRLFVYHSMTHDKISAARFKVMQTKLYNGIMTPSMVATIVFGGIMSYENWQIYTLGYWFYLKLFLVFLLIIYHLYCGHLVQVFKNDKNTKNDKFYRYFNELPALILVAIVILVVVRPF